MEQLEFSFMAVRMQSHATILNYLEIFYEVKDTFTHTCVFGCVQLFGNPMDCSPPSSSVHGIFQARVLEWVAISSPGDLPNPGIEPGSPTLQADTLPCNI